MFGLRFFIVRKKLAIGLLLFLLLFFALNGIAYYYFQGVPVLNYHQINDEAHNVLTLSSSEFEAQMEYLRENGYTSITPEELSDYLETGKELPPKPVLITFDDGYMDNYRVAYPIMQKYHYTATIFLISDFIGNYNRYLTWQQVREMQGQGFVFESHTLNHCLLTELSEEEIEFQLVKSRQALEWQLGKEVEYLAYPGGYYDKRIIKIAKQAGYRGAFTINFGRTGKRHSELFALNRIPIFESKHTFLHFWLRFKFTQLVIALQNLKSFLLREGITRAGNWIYVP